MTVRGGLGGYGHRGDPEGHRVSSSRYLVGTSDTPRRVSLADFMPPVLDQGATSSCTGHAVAEAIVGTLGAQGVQIETPSPAGIYVGGLQMSRSDETPEDAPLPPLVDEGAYPNAVMRGLFELGCGSTIEEWPVDPDTITREPKWGQEQRQSMLRLLGYYKLAGFTLADRVRALRRALAGGYVVCFAIQVDRAFEDYTSGVLGGMQGVTLGGHYLAAHGYEEQSDGSVLVDITNHWGRTWGLTGRARGNSAFVARWTDAYVMKVQKAA